MVIDFILGMLPSFILGMLFTLPICLLRYYLEFGDLKFWKR